MSIYGPTFPDENLTTHKHDKAGMLSMANRSVVVQLCRRTVCKKTNDRSFETHGLASLVLFFLLQLTVDQTVMVANSS
jgi:hypothetical protein